jgi:glycosyltransferase involved in cell wall biosynthesis
VVPNGVDIDHWTRRKPVLGSTIVFCGNLRYHANSDAALHLVTDVMPRVWRKRPHAEVVVVGRDPAPAFRRAVRSPRVTVTGLVPDVRPYLDDAAVFVAPMRFGAGVQNKVLEAMSMEVPVVASPLAAGGLHIGGQDPPVAVRHDPDSMAAQIIERLDVVASNPSPDRAARDWVTDRFVWTRSARQVADAVRMAMAGETGPC